ncbi:MAG: hypothetical protein JSV09_16735 [Thermoplasmata archaeon]|nr:MAG: hypothetical protein JSV09_16735 [Thermoplasmata archaeon]
MNRKWNLISYLIISIIAAILIILVSRFNQSEEGTIGFFDRLLVGGAFIFCCVFGLSLSLRPNWVRRLRKHERYGGHVPESQTTKRHKGHHPDCRGFEGHTLVFYDSTLCAGCTGLAIGSLISILLTILSLGLSIDSSNSILYLLVSLGLIFIALNYIEILIPIRKAYAHLIGNIFLIIGFFLVIIGVFELTGSSAYGLLAVIFSFLWLDTRVQLSTWKHTDICENCTESCKAYSI